MSSMLGTKVGTRLGTDTNTNTHKFRCIHMYIYSCFICSFFHFILCILVLFLTSYEIPTFFIFPLHLLYLFVSNCSWVYLLFFIQVSQGRLGENESRRYFQQLIDAVNYCHKKGVYHRDLKVCYCFMFGFLNPTSHLLWYLSVLGLTNSLCVSLKIFFLIPKGIWKFRTLVLVHCPSKYVLFACCMKCFLSVFFKLLS